MLASLEAPRSRHVDGDTDCVAWEGFDKCSGSTTVSPEEFDEAHGAFGSPDGNDSVKKGELRDFGEFEVIPESDDAEDGEANVKILEGFVKGVSEHRVGLDRNCYKGNSGLWD